MNNLTTIFLDFGSDPAIGLVFIALCIIWFAISIALGSPDNPVKGGRGVNPNRARRQRERRGRRREEEIARLKNVINPNSDDKYIYIMESMGLYKIGISNNVISRRDQIQKELNGEPVWIRYIGAVNYGRTIDAEQIVLNELKQFKQDVIYRNGVNSIEWVNCGLNIIVNKLKNYADLKKI